MKKLLLLLLIMSSLTVGTDVYADYQVEPIRCPDGFKVDNSNGSCVQKYNSGLVTDPNNISDVDRLKELDKSRTKFVVDKCNKEYKRPIMVYENNEFKYSLCSNDLRSIEDKVGMICNRGVKVIYIHTASNDLHPKFMYRCFACIKKFGDSGLEGQDSLFDNDKVFQENYKFHTKGLYCEAVNKIQDRIIPTNETHSDKCKNKGVDGKCQPTPRPKPQPAPTPPPGQQPPTTPPPSSGRGILGNLFGGSGQQGGLLQGMMQKLFGGQQGGGGGAQAPKRPALKKPVCNNFTADKTSIKKGERVTLSWGITGATSAYLSPKPGRINPGGGSYTARPLTNTVYLLQMHNKAGYAKCPPVRVSVSNLDAPGASYGYYNDSITNTNTSQNQNNTKAMLKLRCAPSSVQKGETAHVLWQCSRGTANSVGQSAEVKSFRTKGVLAGSAKVTVNEDSKFVVRCMDKNGRELIAKSCYIHISKADAQIPKSGDYGITADKTVANGGNTITISWYGNGTDNCRVLGPDGFKEYGNKGEVTGRILQTSEFRLQCIKDHKPLPEKKLLIKVN